MHLISKMWKKAMSNHSIGQDHYAGDPDKYFDPNGTKSMTKHKNWITIEDAYERIAEYPPEFQDRIRDLMEKKASSTGEDRRLWKRAEELADILKKGRSIDERVRATGYMPLGDHYRGLLLYFISGVVLGATLMAVLLIGGPQ